MNELQRKFQLYNQAFALAHILLVLAENDRYLAAWDRAEKRRWRRWHAWRALRDQYRKAAE